MVALLGGERGSAMRVFAKLIGATAPSLSTAIAPAVMPQR